jgi:hypothetical protein
MQCLRIYRDVRKKVLSLRIYEEMFGYKCNVYGYNIVSSNYRPLCEILSYYKKKTTYIRLSFFIVLKNDLLNEIHVKFKLIFFINCIAKLNPL